MEVNYGFLCDYADNSGGKLTAVGIGFDTIYARTTPATHRQFFAVISLQFSSVEVGPKDVGLRVVDADGTVIVQLDNTVQVQPPPPGYLYRTQRVAMGLGNVKFESYGDYSVIWLLQGNEIHRASLKIAPPPSSPTTA